jgi:hypothetical protein
LPLAPLQQGLRSQQPAPAVRLLSWRGLGCGFSQPAPPPYPSRLRLLGLRGRKAESPASIRESVVSIHNNCKLRTQLLYSRSIPLETSSQ